MSQQGQQEEHGGSDGKPSKMPDGDDARSGNEIKSLVAGGGKERKTRGKKGR